MQIPAEYAEDFLDRRSSFPATPINTYTNAAYILAGSWLLTFDGALWVIGINMILLGFGSAALHGTASKVGVNLDRFAMHLTVGSIALYALFYSSPNVLAYIALFPAIMGAVAVVATYINLTLLMLLYILLGFGGVVFHGNLQLGSFALVSLALGYLMWHLDKLPTFPLGKYGHGGWHILTALGLTLLALAQTK